MISVDTMQKMINDLYKYKENDKKYNFYYDETNNYRKIRISDKGFNDNKVLTDNYTLGGICIENEKEVDDTILLKELNLQKNQELKSKTFFRGINEFEECICHKKLSLILDWILDNGYIHYSDIDGFYYTVIDIVDSICDTDIGTKLPWDLIQAFKSELYNLLRENFMIFWNLCINTNYPNISSENVELFCNTIINIIEQVDEIEDRWFTLETFRQLVKAKRNSKELIFLKDNLEKTIVESFHYLRQQRCMIFKNSYHIFDEEQEDKEKMKEESMILEDGKILSNFEFKNSKDEIRIQISDIIVYLISRYLKFLTYKSAEEIENIINNMKNEGKENLKKLIQLIDKSNDENPFFIETVTAEQVNFTRAIMNEHIEFLLKIKEKGAVCFE